MQRLGIACIRSINVGLNREPLLKEKAQYNWPPCTNLFGSAAFDIANIFFYKTSYPNEEVNCTL